MSWTTYASHPWDEIETNQRDWYVPELLRAYMRQTRYAQTTPLRIDFTAQATKRMIWTGLFGPEPNWNPIADTSLWLERLYPGGWRQEMTLASYGEGMGLHKYHPLVTYWQMGGGRDALRSIVREYVAQAMMETIEQLIFNAYISKAVNGGVYYLGGDATSFADLADADLYDYTIIPDLELDFKLSGPWRAEIPLWNENNVSAVAFVSPSQTHTIKTGTTTWRDILQYTEGGMQRLFRGEVGGIYGTRFVESDRNILYNFGTLVVCSPIAAAVNPGDGGPDPSSETVDGVRTVGEFTSTDVTPTYYIQLGDQANGGAESWDVGWDTDLATSMAAVYRKGDWVTIFVDQAGASDAPYTQYGPQLSDGKLMYRQIHSVDAANGRLTFTQPILKPLTTVVEAASGSEADCYAYVCRGQHVHTAIHMARFGAVAGGIAAPPRIMFPPAVDDRLAMYRCTWDGVLGYAPFRPELYHLYFTAGYASSMGYMRLGSETT